MGYCIKCGAKAPDGTRYCPQCGAEIPLQGRQEYTYGQDTNQQGYYEQGSRTTGTGYESRQDGGAYFDIEDVRTNKAMGVLSYLGILVLIPILAGNKNSEYVRFHSNQGLVLFIVSVVVNLLSGNWVFGLHSFINFRGWWFGWIFDLIELALFIIAIMGIVHACRGERKELPIIGQIHLFK